MRARTCAGGGCIERERLQVAEQEGPPARAGRPARARSACGRRAGRRGCGAAGTSCPCAGRRSVCAACSATGGHELHRARAGADHRDPLAAQVVAVVPLGGVEAVAGELAPAAAGWRAGAAGRWRRSARRRSRSPGSSHRPAPRRVVPAARVTCVPVSMISVEPVLGDDLVQVAEDVGLGRAQPHPVAALREGERVEVARDVAGGAGVGVVEPRPAEPSAFSRIGRR